MATSAMATLKLPLQFDPSRLRQDLDQISDEQWVPHFNKDLYQGEWSGVSLRKPVDAIHPIQQLYPSPNAKEWVNADPLEYCRYFAEVLSRFRCNILSARLLKLSARSVINKHTDLELSLEDGEVRIHIPVQTTPDVEFFVSGYRVNLQEGEAWYLNASLPHRVSNPGDSDRVHLVMDCVVNDWVHDLFDRALGRGIPLN